MFGFAVRSGNVQFRLMLAIALSLLMWPAASVAYTPEGQQACSDDAFRLCNAEIPDVDRVTACMVRKRSQLSAGCRVFIRPDPDPEVAPVAAGKPLSIRPGHRRKLRKPREPT
jgi:hypothetical protein